MNTLTKGHLHVLQHSIGVDRFGQGTQYRNHFVAAGSDIALCDDLVSHGLMQYQGKCSLTSDLPLYCVTDSGKKYVSDHSEKPPKLSQSQLRYRRFLRSDLDCSFGQFLRMKL
jgi:hypothetical protein